MTKGHFILYLSCNFMHISVPIDLRTIIKKNCAPFWTSTQALI